MSGAFLENIDSEGIVPKSRLDSADKARQLFSRVQAAYNIRSAKNAKVAGAIDGHPPISQETLDKEGLGQMANVNWRQLEAQVNVAQVPYYMLFKDVPNYMVFQVNDPKYNGTDNEKFSEILSAGTSQLLEDWKGFDFNMQLVISDMVKFSPGIAFFPSKEDFRFKCAPTGNVYVDDEVTQELDELTFLWVYYEWTVTELYKKISTDNATDSGWDVERTRKIIVGSCNANGRGRMRGNWEYWENKLRDNDTWFQTADPKVKTAWGYCREFSGKITRTLLCTNEQYGSDDFMFRNDEEYDDWEQIIHPFFAEIGNGHWNGTKGLGIKAFNACDTLNRLKNRMVDGALQASTPILQAKDERAIEALQTMQMGPFNVINAELTPLQFNFGAALDKPLAVSNMLKGDMRENIGQSQMGGSGDSIQPISAEEAKIRAGYDNQLSLAAETRFLNYLDGLYLEIFNRIKVKPRMATKEAPYSTWEKIVAKFHTYLKDFGVPESILNNVKSVKAFRAIGRGSEYLKQQSMGQVYGIVKSDPNVPQQVAISALRMYLSSQIGGAALQMMWPSNKQPSLTEDASKAQDENGIMTQGIVPIYSEDQNSFAHLVTHLKFWTELYEGAVQGQVDPASYLKFAQPATQHLQETFKAVQGDKTKGSAIQGLWNQFQQLVSESKGISQRYAQQQKAAVAQQQAQQLQLQQAQQTGALQDPETQVKMARVRADSQVALYAAQEDAKRKLLKTQVDVGAKLVKTRQDAASKDVLTASQIRNQNKKTTAK